MKRFYDTKSELAEAIATKENRVKSNVLTNLRNIKIHYELVMVGQVVDDDGVIVKEGEPHKVGFFITPAKYLYEG